MADASSEANIIVGVRLRPFVGYEKGQLQSLTISSDGKQVTTRPEVTGTEEKTFKFDHAMDSTDENSPNMVNQVKCYELMAQRMVFHIFQGYNTCLFCYGQTGTGKTTTIMGAIEPKSEQGLLLRLLEDVFIEADRINGQGDGSVKIKVQMLEVYNERIKDLLIVPIKDKMTGQLVAAPKAEVHVHPKTGVYVTGVTAEAVETCEHCLRLIEYGNTMKTIAATAMNAKSSRGHTVFQLCMEKKGGSDNLAMMSEVYFVDLAGRENEKTTRVAGDRLVELTFINRSLMWLSQCIQNLGADSTAKRKTMVMARKSIAPAEMSRKSVPPGKDGTETEGSSASRKSMFGGGERPAGHKDMSMFRNSKLTLLLSSALSGNSKTSMIGTLSPAMLNFEESLSTLKFADTVKNIKVDAKPVSAVDKEAMVSSLQEEVRLLKAQLAAAVEIDDDDANALNNRIEQTQSLSTKLATKWEDGLKQADQDMAQREKAMQKMGAWARDRLPSENPLPYLANFSDDPHLSGRVTLHPLEVNKEYCVGYGDECDFIVPQGLGIAMKTCYLMHAPGNALFIRAIDHEPGARGKQAAVEVDGRRIGSDWVEVAHQDSVVLGRSLMFYAFTKMDGGVQDLVKKLENPLSSAEGRQTSEALLNEILGPSRAADNEQFQLAKKYFRQLQNQNLDAEGATSLHNFLLQAQRALKMVEEANEITAAVKPQTGLIFEMCSMAPVLAFGFGSSSFPEFCVRLIKRVDESQALKKISGEKKRRQSMHAMSDMLRKFTMDGCAQSVELIEAKVEVIHTWHFTKFAARLQLMQDVHEAWAQDPDYEIDSYHDPWSEYGLGEIAQLQQESKDALSGAHEELQRLREEGAASVRDSHIAHNVITRAVEGDLRSGLQMSHMPSSDATHELATLREHYRQLEFANARLKGELAQAQADAQAAIQRGSTVSNGRPSTASNGNGRASAARGGMNLQDDGPGNMSSQSSGGSPQKGNDGVLLCLTVRNISYEALMANAALQAAFVKSLRKTIAQASGPGVTPEHVQVQMSAGSVVVHAQIAPLSEALASSVYSALNASKSQLSDNVSAGLISIPGIVDVATGSIFVSEVSVRKEEYEERSPRSKEGREARGCLELSRANLSLVEDLFRLSLALLRASTATLHSQTPDVATQVNQGRLANAASDLVAFLENRGSVSPSRGGALSPGAPAASWAYPSMINRTESSGSPIPFSAMMAFPQAVGVAPGMLMSSSATAVDVQGNPHRRCGPARAVSSPTKLDVQANGFKPAAMTMQSQMYSPQLRTQASTPGRLRPQMLASPRLAGPN